MFQGDWTSAVIDPLALLGLLWPDDYFYDRQRELIYSVETTPETDVYAGNKLGKDYVTAAIVIAKFLRALKVGRTCRIVTTSVKDEHIAVLWGEIGARLGRAKFPLLYQQGGPLVVNNKRITLVGESDNKNPLSYVKGMVAGDDMDAFAGHHAEETLAVGDEASGLDDLVHNKFQGWAARMLFIGNPNPCQNFYRRAKREGDLRDARGKLIRKIIHISADESPNVRAGRAQVAAGLEVKPVMAGVLSYDDYLLRDASWDKIRKTIGLKGEFYEGAELMLFPEEWLANSQRVWSPAGRRQARAIGVDPAEGGDKTTMAAVDEFGLIELTSKPTPNTMVIIRECIDFARRLGCPMDKVCFDAGGGGHQLVDRLKEMGHEGVRTVAFGGQVDLPIQRRKHHPWKRRVNKEERYAYFNRRAEMYGELSEEMDPYRYEDGSVFAIPPDSEGPQYAELRRQLSLIPKDYDKEQKLVLPPKRRNPGEKENAKKTLIEIIGNSPDEADAVAIALWAMTNVSNVMAGAAC